MVSNRFNSAKPTLLITLLAAFALLLGVYYSLRFGGWETESDASRQAISAEGIVVSGKLLNNSAYNNGFGYGAQLAIISEVTGLAVQTVQLGSSLWVFVLAIVAFITYQEFLGSYLVSALTVFLLFIQPDFLFYVVRGSHERNTWAFALLMLFLLMRSNQFSEQPRKLLICVGLFYLVFWGLISSNVFFGTTFMAAILLSYIGGWVLNRFGMKKQHKNKSRKGIVQRLIVISLACLVMIFVFINYTYEPALQFYELFTTMADKIGLMVLGSQPVDAPASYQYFTQAWRSQLGYLGLTGAQWLIAGLSLVGWALGLLGLSKMDMKEWLVWLMYSAFGFLLVVGVVTDNAGVFSANMQMRMFTPFTLFSSPLAAGIVLRGVYKLRVHWRAVVKVAMVIMLLTGVITVPLKVTNDPSFGNQWLFYTPAELAPFYWLDRNQVKQYQVWVGISKQLDLAYYFWLGSSPPMQYQFRTGSLQSTVPYTLISDLTRLRANRSGISLPETSDQNQIYDDGTVKIYHRTPLTPYQH